MTPAHPASLVPAVRPRAGRARPPVLACAALALLLAGCDPDVAERAEPAVDGGPTTPDPGPMTPIEPVVDEPTAAVDFSLSVTDAPVALVEGAETSVAITVAVTRGADHSRPVTLAAFEEGGDVDGLVWSFADASLDATGSETTLNVALPIGALPRLPGTRRLRLVATDDAGAEAAAELAFETTPTDRPDIYVLAGQSNMVGSTLDGARMMGPGEPDAPDPRIFQLDVTINEESRFPDAASYTDIDLIAPPDDRIVQALDPLHDRRDRGKDTKSGTTIGLGLTFAKEALAGTTADIVLVPTAWSDTGFCLRDTSRYEGGTGWNAVRPAGDAFAGTLLHDRAIARADLAIAETGGILRGILWHQGEADSDDPVCARAYADNLRAMVASFRENIAPDARGADARGADADIPFVLATMSKGADDRAPPLAPGGTFPEPKSIVDAAHRNVASIVPLAGVVIADDLVPEAFPCGQGFCIHFGATALRELGVRYYRELVGLLDGR